MNPSASDTSASATRNGCAAPKNPAAPNSPAPAMKNPTGIQQLPAATRLTIAASGAAIVARFMPASLPGKNTPGGARATPLERPPAPGPQWTRFLPREGTFHAKPAQAAVARGRPRSLPRFPGRRPNAAQRPVHRDRRPEPLGRLSPPQRPGEDSEPRPDRAARVALHPQLLRRAGLQPLAHGADVGAASFDERRLRQRHRLAPAGLRGI